MAYVNLGQVMYPVGAYFFSNNSASPSSLFGGTWTAVDAGRFICAAGSGYDAGVQGGASSVALVCNQLPAAVWFCGGVTDGPYPTDLAIAVNSGGQYGMHTRSGIDANAARNAHENRPLFRAAYIWRRTA